MSWGGMGRASACFSGFFLLRGRGRGPICVWGVGVFLCASTGGRWLPRKPTVFGSSQSGATHLVFPTILQQVFPTVLGDLDSSGSLNAQVLLLLAERLRAKAVFQVTHGSCLHLPKHFPPLPPASWGEWGGAPGRGAEVVVMANGERGFTCSSPHPDTAVQVPDMAV